MQLIEDFNWSPVCSTDQQILMGPAFQSEHQLVPASLFRWSESQTAYRPPSAQAPSAFPRCRSARALLVQLLSPPLWLFSQLHFQHQLHGHTNHGLVIKHATHSPLGVSCFVALKSGIKINRSTKKKPL